MQPDDAPASIELLRARLKSNPEDWNVRLALAEAQVAAGNEQQAAILISTAPAEPQDVEHLVRAANFALALDNRLAMRFADAALAHDESNVEAALLRARIHQKRREPKDAYRFALVAGALAPDRTLKEAALLAWLAAEGLLVPVESSAKPEEQTSPPTPQRPSMQSARPALLTRPAMKASSAPDGAASPSPQRDESPPIAVAIVEEDEEPIAERDTGDEPLATAVTAEDEADDGEAAAIAIVDAGAKKADRVASVSDSQARDDNDAMPVVADEETDTATGKQPKPARNRLILRQVSAAAIAIVVHAALVGLLGVLVIIVPPPKVAEIVGVVAPEIVQEQPQTKQLVPTSMPSAAPVAGAPARAITAAGISSIALPEFDAKTEGPMVTEIATTDLGASFAMPFSPKGTSKVNFFGIKSQGRRVAFLIDAERYMLTDPRGGYPAYEIVKNEIAGMIGKLGLETHFNVLLYEGANLSAFSEKLVPATTANKDKVRDWLYPVNREFEKLGIRPIGYPVLQVQTEVEPVPNQYLSGYLRAIQYALETDVDAVFIITSGWRSMETPRTPDELEKIRKQLRWTEKDDIAWREAIKKGQDWLKKENAARKAKGVPERVIVNIGEVWRDMGFRPPRSPPGGIQITAEEREDQVRNAIRILYSAKGKPKPQINFVIFIGKDQNEKTVPNVEHFENIAQRARSGKVRVLQGLAALKNVTGGG